MLKQTTAAVLIQLVHKCCKQLDKVSKEFALICVDQNLIALFFSLHAKLSFKSLSKGPWSIVHFNFLTKLNSCAPT